MEYEQFSTQIAFVYLRKVILLILNSSRLNQEHAFGVAIKSITQVSQSEDVQNKNNLDFFQN